MGKKYGGRHPLRDKCLQWQETPHDSRMMQSKALLKRMRVEPRESHGKPFIPLRESRKEKHAFTSNLRESEGRPP